LKNIIGAFDLGFGVLAPRFLPLFTLYYFSIF
jgi:hypothetical protein